MEVAEKLLESQTLYSSAIHLAHVSGPTNENLSAIFEPATAPQP